MCHRIFRSGTECEKISDNIADVDFYAVLSPEYQLGWSRTWHMVSARFWRSHRDDATSTKLRTTISWRQYLIHFHTHTEWESTSLPILQRISSWRVRRSTKSTTKWRSDICTRFERHSTNFQDFPVNVSIWGDCLCASSSLWRITKTSEGWQWLSVLHGRKIWHS